MKHSLVYPISSRCSHFIIVWQAADIVRGLTGIFVATGQPSDFRSDALENKEDFAARLRYVAAESNEMKKKAFEGRDKASAALREVAKKADLDEKKKEEEKKDLQGKLAQLLLIGRTTGAVVKLSRVSAHIPFGPFIIVVAVLSHSCC
jgi:hypothetical protein